MHVFTYIYILTVLMVGKKLTFLGEYEVPTLLQ